MRDAIFLLFHLSCANSRNYVETRIIRLRIHSILLPLFFLWALFNQTKMKEQFNNIPLTRNCNMLNAVGFALLALAFLFAEALLFIPCKRGTIRIIVTLPCQFDIWQLELGVPRLKP